MAKSYLYFDVESFPIDNAADFLEPPDADARLTDAVKIQTDIAKKTAAMFDRCGLDWNVARIVALAYARDDEPVTVHLTPHGEAEAILLANFWDEVRVPGTVVVGYNIRAFDVPLLIQRSRYLGIKPPTLSLARFRRDPIFDLYDELTFDQVRNDKPVMRQTLKAFAKRFGIEVTDPYDGADIAGLVREGAWDAIRTHCESDVELARQLAAKLGVGDRQVAHV